MTVNTRFSGRPGSRGSLLQRLQHRLPVVCFLWAVGFTQIYLILIKCLKCGPWPVCLFGL